MKTRRSLGIVLGIGFFALLCIGVLQGTQQPVAVQAEQLPAKSHYTTCRTYESNNVPLAIPDNSPKGITSRMNIVNSDYVYDVTFTATIEHTYFSDLSATLCMPWGSCKVLVAGDMSGYGVFTFSINDSASQYVWQDNPPYGGTYKPSDSGYPDYLVQSLDGMGRRANGAYTLNVVDDYLGDTGTLLAWSVTLCTNPVKPTPVPTATPPATYTPEPTAVVGIYSYVTNHHYGLSDPPPPYTVINPFWVLTPGPHPWPPLLGHTRYDVSYSDLGEDNGVVLPNLPNGLGSVGIWEEVQALADYRTVRYRMSAEACRCYDIAKPGGPVYGDPSMHFSIGTPTCTRTDYEVDHGASVAYCRIMNCSVVGSYFQSGSMTRYGSSGPLCAIISGVTLIGADAIHTWESGIKSDCRTDGHLDLSVSFDPSIPPTPVPSCRQSTPTPVPTPVVTPCVASGGNWFIW